ncbi:MAG: O-antigen ligase family protein [Pseudomonadota bacterium]
MAGSFDPALLALHDEDRAMLVIIRRRHRWRRSPLFNNIMITALLSAIVIQSAMIFDLFWPAATYVGYWIQAAVFLFYLILPLSRIRPSVVGSAIIILLFLIVEHIRFCVMADESYNFNSLLFYLPFLSFLPLYKSGVSINTIAKILFWICVIYIFTYVVGYDRILSGSLGDNRAIKDGDFARGARLYLATVFAAFVAFYSVTNKSIPIVVRAIIFVIAFYALVLSGSRTYGVIFMLVLVLSSIRLFGMATRVLLFSIVMIICGLVMLGLLVPGWNPFAQMSSDGSGFARSLEYEVAMRVIKDHWFLGVGIANNFDAQQIFFKTREYLPLYPSDLGILGPLILFGIPGLLVFIAATYLCMVPSLGRHDGSGFRGVQLTAFTCAAFGVISPSLLLEPNAVFLMMLIVARLRDGPLFRVFQFEKLWFEAVSTDQGTVMQRVMAVVSIRHRRIYGADHYTPLTMTDPDTDTDSDRDQRPKT